MNEPFLIAVFLLLSIFAADLASGNEETPLIGTILLISLIVWAFFRLLLFFFKRKDSE